MSYRIEMNESNVLRVKKDIIEVIHQEVGVSRSNYYHNVISSKGGIVLLEKNNETVGTIRDGWLRGPAVVFVEDEDEVIVVTIEIGR